MKRALQIFWMILTLFALRADAGTGEQAAERLALGKDLAGQGKLDDAARELRSAVQLDPANAEAHRALGDVYARLKDTQAAMQEYQEVVSLRPGDADARLKVGTIYLLGRRFEDAAAQARKAAELAPNRHEPLVLLGRAEGSLGRWDAAIDALKRAVRAAPDNEALRVELANVYGAAKDLPKAEQALRDGLDAIPPSQVIRVALANVLLAQRRPAEADDVVRELVNLAPGDRGMHRTAALYYLKRGERKEAEALLKRAFDLAGDRAADRIQSLGDLSNFYAVTGNLAGAGAALEESRKIAPDDVGTLSRLGSLYLLLDDREKAKPVIGRLRELAPAEPATRVLEARLDFADGRTAEAKKVLEEVVDTAPDSQYARFFLAKAYAVERQWEKAVAAYRKVLDDVPDHFFANLDLAKVYLNMGRPAEALEPIDKVLRVKPGYADALRVRAEALLGSGKAQEAEQVIRGLLAGAPDADRAALEMRLGQSLEAQNRSTDALERYRESHRLAPAAVEPVLRQIDLLDRLDRRAEADRLAEEFLKGGGGSAPLLVTLAVRALDHKDREAARAYLTRGLEMDPRSAPGRELEARLLLADGDEASARKSLELALQSSPERVSTLLLLATLVEKTGTTEEKQALYERVLRVDPDNAVAANNLAVVYAEDPKRLPEALRLAKLAADRAPKSPFTLDTLGWVLYRSGDYSGAVPNLEEARRLLPSHPEIAFHLGAAYAKVGKSEKARLLLQEALEKADGRPWTQEARGLLARLESPAR